MSIERTDRGYKMITADGDIMTAPDLRGPWTFSGENVSPPKKKLVLYNHHDDKPEMSTQPINTLKPI